MRKEEKKSLACPNTPGMTQLHKKSTPNTVYMTRELTSAQSVDSRRVTKTGTPGVFPGNVNTPYISFVLRGSPADPKTSSRKDTPVERHTHIQHHDASPQSETFHNASIPLATRNKRSRQDETKKIVQYVEHTIIP